MPLFIIFGTRGVTWTLKSGQFACPGCGGTQQAYDHKSVRRFFTLYFIPVIPLNKLGEYVQCRRCGGQYNVEVLDHDPAAQSARLRAEFIEHTKRVMILAALADGEVDDREAEAITRIYRDLSGAELTGPELRREVALARQAGVTAPEYAGRFAETLNEHGKEMVLRSVMLVLGADGRSDEAAGKLLLDLGRVLNVSAAHFRGIVAEMSEPSEPDRLT
jgi:uncharacterized membrane protein YebE (DUF533 family)